MQKGSSLPHEVLFQLANGEPVTNADGELEYPTIKDRIQAANACTRYYAQQHVEQVQKGEVNFQTEVIKYFQIIAMKLPV